MGKQSKVWLITGASKGFGRAAVELALKKGDAVVATLRSAEVLEQFKADFPPESQLLALKMDITDKEEVMSGFARAKEVFGRIDVVFNTAGRGYLGEVESTDDAMAREVVELNFWGAVNISREAIRFFREENSPPHGRLLNVSSGAGMVGMPAGAFFVAAKHALEGFSESLSMELDPDWNIKVTVVEPGGFRTKAPQGNIRQLPVHPAYHREKMPSYQLRKLFDTRPAMGSPTKAAGRIYDLAELENPPLRLALGEDCVQAIRAKLTSVLEDLDKYAFWSRNLMVDPDKRDVSPSDVKREISPEKEGDASPIQEERRRGWSLSKERKRDESPSEEKKRDASPHKERRRRFSLLRSKEDKGQAQADVQAQAVKG